MTTHPTIATTSARRQLWSSLSTRDKQARLQVLRRHQARAAEHDLRRLQVLR